MPIDFKKLPADKHVTVALAPSGPSPLGIQNVYAPTAAELNNTGGVSGAINASEAISWTDWDFGTQASETTNEPSLADSASYEEFGQSNFGGSQSYFEPLRYHDNSNLASVVYDLTKEPGVLIDSAVRIDGDVETTVPFADGDFVSVYRVQGNSEQNPFTPGESKRRTVGYTQKSEFSHYTVVGAHTITVIPPTGVAVGDRGRIRASVQGRDYTNALDFATSDANVLQVYPGGFYAAIGAGTATITVRDKAGTSKTETITVA